MEAVVSARDGEDSVSSVIGTVLMLAVTVAVFGGLSVVVLSEIRSTDSPPEAELAFVSDGTRAILTHRGGEAIDLDDGFLLLNVDGAQIRYELTDLADQTADGRFWRIGETLCLSGPSPPDPARPCLVEEQVILGVALVAGGGLLADEGERGGDAGPCPLDNVAPTATLPWVFEPADLFSTMTGSVTVRLATTDDCSGIDDAVAPDLFYRIDDGTSPGPAFIALGGMANDGPGLWSGVVPAQSWNLLGGKSLEVYASGGQDANGNVAGDTGRGSEPIVAVTLTSYVTAATPPGGVTDLDRAQASGDGDAAATIAESGTVVPAGTGGPTRFSGTAQVATGTPTNAANVLASDNAAAEFTAGGQAIEVSGFDLPSNAATVTAITIGFEGRRESGGGSTPTLSLDYKIGSGTYSTYSVPISSTTDVDHPRNLSGLTVNDVETMTVRLRYATDVQRNPFVDHVFARVTYTTPAMTTYSLDIVLDFADTEDGATETLDLRYQTAGDTFRLEVWDAAAPIPAYAQRGTLSSVGSFVTFTYQLTAGEYNGGAPRIRLVDETPAGTTAGSLQFDYARVVTT